MCGDGGAGDGDDELIAFFDGCADADFIGLGDGAWLRMKIGCDGGDGLARLHFMEAPGGTLVFGDLLDAIVVELGGADGDVQIEGDIVGRAEAQERGVECDELADAAAGDIGDEMEIDGVVGGDGVVDDGGDWARAYRAHSAPGSWP